MTQKILKHLTCSIILFPIIIGLSNTFELRRKLTNVSLHFVGFNFILGAMAKLWKSEAAQFKRLIEFLWIISRGDESSTNLIRGCQSDSSLFIITVKRITPSLPLVFLLSVVSSLIALLQSEQPADGWSGSDPAQEYRIDFQFV